MWIAIASVAQAIAALALVYLTLRYVKLTEKLATASSEQLRATVAQFVSESVGRLKENKPVVFTDAAISGQVIRNVGGSFAVNVWCLTDGGPTVPLGSLAAGEARPLEQPINQPHLLLAEARPLSGRPWTISTNIPLAGTVVHGFADPTRLDREVPIGDFLKDERIGLLEQLKKHSARSEMEG
jgi:hypothetical protein